MYKLLFPLAFSPIFLNTNISLGISFIKLLTIFSFLSKTVGALYCVGFFVVVLGFVFLNWGRYVLPEDLKLLHHYRSTFSSFTPL